MFLKKNAHRWLQSLLPLAFCCVAGAYAAEPVLKAGQWDGTRNLILNDLPLPPKPHTMSTCMKADDVAKRPEMLTPLRANAATEQCVLGDWSVKGTSWSTTLTCKPLGKNGTLEMTMGADETQSKLVLFKGENEQAGVWLTLTDNYKRSSDSCAS